MNDRVAVDGFGLEDGSRHRGIGTYLRHLIGGLAGRADVDLIVLAGPKAELPNDASRLVVPSLLPRRWQRAERERRLAGAASRAGAKALHTTGQVLPRHSSVPWIHTLHDLSPLYFRDHLLDEERDYWLSVGPRLRAASAVICPSRSSADQGIEYLGLDPRRLHVIPHGVDDAFTPEGTVATYDGPYLLWVATWGPHKGLDEALAVTAALAKAGYPHRLVIAGYIEAHLESPIEQAIVRAACAERVVRAGRVDDLAAVYRGASALLVTSRAEGFGLPALEAMACGTPVVSFDNTALREVVGGAGSLVADGDVPAMVSAVRTVLDDDAARQTLVRDGSRRAAEHTWQSSVAAHVAIYRSVQE